MKIILKKKEFEKNSKYLLKLKLDKHAEKISDIFKAYCDNVPHSESEDEGESTNRNVKLKAIKPAPETDNNEDDKSENDETEKLTETKREDDESHNKPKAIKDKEDKKDSVVSISKHNEDDLMMQVPQVKINKINKVLKDLGYLIGMVFVSHEDYIKGTYDNKKTDKKMIDKIQHYCWKRIHTEEWIEKVQRGSAKSQGTSILKNTKEKNNYTENNISARKESEVSDSETKKSQTNRPDTVVTDESKSSDKTKKTKKTEKTEKTEKSEKTEKESEEDEQNNGQTSVAQSPTNTKKSTTTAVVVKEPSQTKIRFEDYAYRIEKFEKELDANLFMGYLNEFIEEEEDVLLVTSDNNNGGKLC